MKIACYETSWLQLMGKEDDLLLIKKYFKYIYKTLKDYTVHIVQLMNCMKRQKYMTLKDELPKLVDAQYATGEEQTNISRRNEEAEPKQKQPRVVDVSGGGSKVSAVKKNIAWEPGMFRESSEIHFSSVAQSCPTLCNPMNRSTPALPIHHQLPESTQTHVY